MVPGFMKLSQDDQIVLLKAGKLRIGYEWYICLNIRWTSGIVLTAGRIQDWVCRDKGEAISLKLFSAFDV